MNLYEEAIKIWLARKFGPGKFWAEDVSDIEFSTEGFGCSTCWTERTVIKFTVTRNGEKQTHTKSVEEMSPAQLIKECLEIYLTLSHQKGYAALA